MSKLKTAERQQVFLSTSLQTSVSIRMIQGYEQGLKDINKAQAMTVYKLAKTLDCTMSELLET